MKHLSPALELYCDLVAREPVSLTAIRDPVELRRELVGDALTACATIGERLPGDVVDVGSGNGSPGIPLALHYGQPVTLLDSVVRKGAFLRHAVALLGIECPVVVERSETYARGAGRDAFDLALARALAPPAVALELCLPLVRPGGRVMLWTGRVDAAALERVAVLLGGGSPRAIETSTGRQLLVVDKVSATPERFPRRPGMAGKRPLASLPSTP
ncbi:MAG: rRNA (guanine527-N7)-methyltransferase [Gaiellales bacterium]|nr:rRNA (guanine527-N7)-methyltransferase [Gaiellales bacterium]